MMECGTSLYIEFILRSERQKYGSYTCLDPFGEGLHKIQRLSTESELLGQISPRD